MGTAGHRLSETAFRLIKTHPPRGPNRLDDVWFNKAESASYRRLLMESRAHPLSTTDLPVDGTQVGSSPNPSYDVWFNKAESRSHRRLLMEAAETAETAGHPLLKSAFQLVKTHPPCGP
jgi:hypothetical protein